MWKIQRKLPPKTHYPSFLLLKLHNESVPVMFGRTVPPILEIKKNIPVINNHVLFLLVTNCFIVH